MDNSIVSTSIRQDIEMYLYDKYNIDKIYFAKKQFINMKYRIKQQNEFNKVKEERLKNLDFGEKGYENVI